MKRVPFVLVVYLLFSSPAMCAESRELLAIFSELVIRAMRQGPHAEAAAFVVQENDGELKCYLWPRTTELFRQSYEGERPDGTVAIVHTHPEGYGSNPSLADRATARSTGLPVFVATLWEVTMFDPATGHTRKVNESRRWRAAIGRRPALCADASVWARGANRRAAGIELGSERR